MELKEVLSENGIEFTYYDISLDFGALKRFLKIRDTNPLYIPVKEGGRVGIPTVILDNEVMLGLEDEQIEELMNNR
ncbi:MAG: glutaredoxin-like protein [Clostridia bacterium]|nr:glutaredoxin-like protein [Clostridia bacterium]